MNEDALDDNQIRARTICGNLVGDDVYVLRQIWEQKMPLLPRDLVIEAARLVKLVDFYTHASAGAALRARGVVWIVGLTQIGKEFHAALVADDGDGKTVLAFIHGVSPVGDQQGLPNE